MAGARGAVRARGLRVGAAATGVAAMGMVGAACGGGPTPSGGAGPGTTSAPPSPTTSTPATATHCQAGGLSGSVEGAQGAAGTIEVTVQVRNTGTASCTLEGYPGVLLVDANGAELHTSVIRGGTYGFTALTPASVTIAPQSPAFLNIGYSDVPSGHAPCEAAASLWITPPEDVDHVVVTVQSTVCGGMLSVSPFLGAGSPGTQTTAPPH